MSIIGNSISIGGSEDFSNILVKAHTNSSTLMNGAITRGQYFNIPCSFVYPDSITGNYIYYFIVPLSSLTSSSTTYIVDIENELYKGVTYISLSNSDGSYEYDVDVNITLAVYDIWNGADEDAYMGGNAGGFTALKGTASSQSDTLTWNNERIEYLERNNDYGGFRTNNKISFAGYNTLRIVCSQVSSWQDFASPSTQYSAKLVISTSAYSSTTSSGLITSYNDAVSLAPLATGHLIDVAVNQYMTIKNYNSDYYIYVLVASGENSGAGKGHVSCQRIYLTV